MAVSINFVTLVALAAVVNLPPMAATSVFLNGSSEVLRRDRIVDQLRSWLGHGLNVERRVAIEELLRPTFMALPKDPSGNLGRRAACNALHRYFSVEYGWSIEGLSLEIPENHTVPLAPILETQMPSLVMNLLKEQIGSDRVGLDELVVMAATIEDLVQSHAVDVLSLAYETYNLSKDEPLYPEDADILIRTFMVFYNHPEFQQFADDESSILFILRNYSSSQLYPQLDDHMLWVDDVYQSLAFRDRSFLRPAFGVAGQPMDFSAAASLARAIVLGLGKFANLECSWIKRNLMDLGGDGRVPLGKFYDPFPSDVRNGYIVSPASLRHFGALDERNPRRPSVVVPNLIYSQLHCLNTVGFKPTCCLDACEVLMANLEKQVSQPTASPAFIAAVVSAMPSDTVAAPRILPASLLSRLDKIAGRHGGRVHLHSRLFAEWMHNAFPNECMYPRSLLTSEVQVKKLGWCKQAGNNCTVTEQEKTMAKDQWEDSEQTGASEGIVDLWSEDEVLLSDLVVPQNGILLCVLKYLANASVLMLSVLALVNFLRSRRDQGHGKVGRVSEGAYAV